MRIVALGAGNMGRRAVQALLREADVDEVVVADVDLASAEAFVGSQGDDRLRAASVDLLDHDAAVALLDGSDAVMNTAGPFFRLGTSAVTTAIAAGVPYADIDDDYLSTEGVLALDEAARAAGVPVVVGIGAPGISNLLAKKACGELDEVEHVQTAWCSVGGVVWRRPALVTEVADARPPADLVHGMHAIAGTVPVWRDGRRVEERPLVYGEDVVFPNGVARFRLIGHPEPVTIPKFIPGVRGCVNLFGDSPESYEVMEMLAPKITTGEVDAEEAARIYLVERQRRVAERPEILDLGPRLGQGVHASATGRKDGERHLVAYGTKARPTGSMAGVTGIPLAIAVGMLLRGEVAEPGVFAPEGCIDPDAFFDRYQSYCEDLSEVGGLLYDVHQQLQQKEGTTGR